MGKSGNEDDCWAVFGLMEVLVIISEEVLGSEDEEEKVPERVWVAKRRNSGGAWISSLRLEMNRVRFSTSTLTTSMGARLMSSTSSQWPSRTAWVRMPGCHLNSPGTSVQM